MIDGVNRPMAVNGIIHLKPSMVNEFLTFKPLEGFMYQFHDSQNQIQTGTVMCPHCSNLFYISFPGVQANNRQLDAFNQNQQTSIPINAGSQPTVKPPQVNVKPLDQATAQKQGDLWGTINKVMFAFFITVMVIMIFKSWLHAETTDPKPLDQDFAQYLKFVERNQAQFKPIDPKHFPPQWESFQGMKGKEARDLSEYEIFLEYCAINAIDDKSNGGFKGYSQRKQENEAYLKKHPAETIILYRDSAGNYHREKPINIAGGTK